MCVNKDPHKKFHIILITCVFAILIVFVFTFKSCFNTIETTPNYLDTIQKYKDIYNREVVTAKVLRSTNASILLTIKSKDVTINRLQEVVKASSADNQRLRMVLVSNTNTILSLRDSLDNLICDWDTTYDSDSTIVNIYPTYKRDFKDSIWYKGNITLGKSIFSLNLITDNSFAVTVGTKGFIKQQSFVNITNFNPYCTTKDAIVWEKKTKLNSNVYTIPIAIVIGITIAKLLL